MSKKNALLGQCDLLSALTELSGMFSGTGFKVVMALISRMDYKLENTLSVMSLRELRKRTAKKNQQILGAIEELESRGLLVKTSGKYHKEDARMLRAILYHREQDKMRSYYETNAYDLRGLVELVRAYLELVNQYGRDEALDIMNSIREQAYMIEKKTGKKASYLDLLRNRENRDSHIQQSDSHIQQSDSHIQQSDSHIQQSDSHIQQKPPSLPIAPNHTHTPAGGNHEGNSNEGRGDISNEGKISNERKYIGTEPLNFQTDIPLYREQHTDTATATATATATMPTTANEWERLLAENEAFQEYIRQRIEDDPKVLSKNAVYESIKKKPDLIKAYYKEWQQVMEQAKRSDKRVILIPKPVYEQHLEKLFGDKYRDVIAKLQQAGRIGEAGAYVFILLEVEKVEKLKSRAESRGISLHVEEYSKEYASMFKV